MAPEDTKDSLFEGNKKSWGNQFEENRGVSLLTLLKEEPRLVSIRCLDSTNINILHLAVRNNWYGMVAEIAQIFKSGDRDVFNSRMLRNLFAEKEQNRGHAGVYSSGLDVLAMASIQCHKAVNSLLAEMYWSHGSSHSNSLFVYGDPYSHAMNELLIAREGGETDADCDQSNALAGGGESGADCDLLDAESDRGIPKDLNADIYWRAETRAHNPQREVLTQILEVVFPRIREVSGLKRAPNYRGDLFSADSYWALPMWVQQWMLTSPFLPVSEYLILEWSKDSPSWARLMLGLDTSDKVLLRDRILEKGEDIAFVKYLLQVNDTRRTVFHYALADGEVSDTFRPLLDKWSDILHRIRSRPINHAGASLLRPVASTSASKSDFLEELRGCFQMLDSSGRTPLEVYFATQVNLTCQIPSMRRTLELFRILQPFDSVIRRGPPYWDTDQHYIYSWAVHRENGYYFPAGDYFREALYRGKIDTLSLANLFCTPYVRNGHTLADVVISCRSLTSERRIEVMKLLLDFPEFLPDSLTQRVRMRESEGQSPRGGDLTLLQHAVLLGDTEMVRLLAKDNRAYDPARFNNFVTKMDNPTRLELKNQELLEDFRSTRVISTSALQFAAEQGRPEMIRILLDSGAFDPCYRDEHGDTALHYAARSSGPLSLPVSLYEYVEIPLGTGDSQSQLQCGNFYGPKGLQTVKLPLERGKQQDTRYQACLNMLLQAGNYIWQVNNQNLIASLHEDASPEYSLWWFEKQDRETQEQTTKLTAAANALSVTAALVATASYIGPLQPPLGYGPDRNDPTDTVQADIVSVRIFIVCNTLAFYIALVAIMFSLTPSLPMPQESMADELKRIRRSVTLALVSLITAIVTILFAFASASIAVLPKSWSHKGLSGGTLAAGGLMCLVMLVLCCIRAVRIMFHKSEAIRRFYKRWVYI